MKPSNALQVLYDGTTTVDGNGRNPGEKEILAVGIAAGMARAECRRIMNQIKDCVNQMLGQYLS